MRRALVAVSLAVVLLAAACGGKSRLSRADFVSKATVNCRAYEAKQNAIVFPTVNPVGKKTTHAERAQWGLALKQIVDIGDQELKELRTLRPPKELQDSYDRLLASWQHAYDTLREGAVAAKRNDVAGLKQKVPEGRRKLAEVSKQAKPLGLTGCL
jgi:hypothetical protein